MILLLHTESYAHCTRFESIIVPPTQHSPIEQEAHHEETPSSGLPKTKRGNCSSPLAQTPLQDGAGFLFIPNANVSLSRPIVLTNQLTAQAPPPEPAYKPACPGARGPPPVPALPRSHNRAAFNKTVIEEESWSRVLLPRWSGRTAAGLILSSLGQKDNRPGDKFQLTFPLRTNYMYAKVKKSLPEMYAFTVCMWLKSSAAPGVGTPFSYAVPGQANELVLIEWGNNPMEILINDKVAKLPFVINDGKWHHICVTWTTRDGVWEAYQDGTQGGNGENLAPYHPIKPQGVLVLGQEQDTLGGGFDATQAFVGELAHFNIWDRKLTPGEVYNLATCSSKALSGNVIAWAESQIEIFGGATKWTFEACRQIN